MDVTEKAIKIMKNSYVCDHCLGRQFAELLSGYSNKERGETLRKAVAMDYDSKPFPIHLPNFSGLRFRNSKPDIGKSGRCCVCGDLFSYMEKYAKESEKKMKIYEFDTFVVGSKMSDSLVMKEESLWERVGIKGSEHLRSEVNRELGKLIESMTGKQADEKNPNVTVLLDLQKKRVEIKSNPLYVYGKYNKLIRGIPQTKWSKYKVSVEDIIAKPFMKFSGANGHSMHACGREDIDARCLGWRPFVLELENPAKRKPDLSKMRKEINRAGKVKVKDMKFSNRKEVVAVKTMQPDKVYSVVVKFENPVEAMERIKKAIGTIKQRTPKRVLHRRANKLRNKKVKSIKWTKINKSKYKIVIHTEAGAYIKEFVSGDDGRTKPSISEILKNRAVVESLDVIKIMVR
ncbi:MAG: tRNA pseudouridine(54/55) synthase Pus10 [Candidatus Aenigmarchaeota archaeon]|nr:tRNA pseudouridine(54/55) synthase Pus10 [Candidatus Aenigmarchaeota archaeon]